MNLKPAVLLSAAALALSFGTAQAAGAAAHDKGGNPVFSDAPGFNDLDKNHDGSLSRPEAAGNAKLAARFEQVDSNGDGKLSRAEYLKTMAKTDFNSLREKAADWIAPDHPSSTGSGAASPRK